MSMVLTLMNTLNLIVGIVLYALGIGGLLFSLLLTMSMVRTLSEGSGVSFVAIATIALWAATGTLMFYSGSSIISGLLPLITQFL